MARPKSTTPKKAHLNITVTEETRANLAYLAAHNKQSISEWIADTASREARKAMKKAGVSPNTPEQTKLF